MPFRMTLAAFLFALCVLPGSVTTADEPLRILVANDDGIDSPQMAALAEGLAAIAEVTVVAPEGNQSGSSHSTKTLSARGEGVRVRTVRKDGAIAGYAVQGTPADAVRWGLLVLGESNPFDLVVSGINDGANVGVVAHLSGTVGAAMEAVLQGVPAIAVSQASGPRTDTNIAIDLTRKLIVTLQARGFPEKSIVSINVPSGPVKGVKVLPMGGSYIGMSGFTETSQDGDVTTYKPKLQFLRETDPGTDAQAYLEGYATITPLRFDWTDEALLKELSAYQWDMSGRQGVSR